MDSELLKIANDRLNLAYGLFGDDFPRMGIRTIVFDAMCIIQYLKDGRTENMSCQVTADLMDKFRTTNLQVCECGKINYFNKS